MPDTIAFSELEGLKQALRSQDHGAWVQFSGRYLALPDWYVPLLDPMTEAYRKQQFALWKMLGSSSEDYEAERDEQFCDDGMDVVRTPGFYHARTPGAVAVAGNHLIALGHLLKCSQLVAGDWALEYGAGYGQIAVALGRLGVNVDTVDINPIYNAAIKKQAEHFGIPLQSFMGIFGDEPRRGQQYDLILFYEAFHHCADFLDLPAKLARLLKPGGKILMAGEPIGNNSPSWPYPWGIRLDAEAVAVSGVRRWLELGFTEDFLVSLFLRHGFIWRKHPCSITHYGIIHEFTLRPDRISMALYSLPEDQDATWNGAEPPGRWSRGNSLLTLNDLGAARWVTLTTVSHNPQPVVVAFSGDEMLVEVHYMPADTKEVTLETSKIGRALQIRSDIFKGTNYGREDARELGIFVVAITYS